MAWGNTCLVRKYSNKFFPGTLKKVSFIYMLEVHQNESLLKLLSTIFIAFCDTPSL